MWFGVFAFIPTFDGVTSAIVMSGLEVLLNWQDPKEVHENKNYWKCKI